MQYLALPREVIVSLEHFIAEECIALLLSLDMEPFLQAYFELLGDSLGGLCSVDSAY